MRINTRHLEKLALWLKPKDKLKFVLDEKEIDESEKNTTWVYFHVSSHIHIQPVD